MKRNVKLKFWMAAVAAVVMVGVAEAAISANKKRTEVTVVNTTGRRMVVRQQGKAYNLAPVSSLGNFSSLDLDLRPGPVYVAVGIARGSFKVPRAGYWKCTPYVQGNHVICPLLEK